MNPEGWQEQRKEFITRAAEVAKAEVTDLLLAKQQVEIKLFKINRRLQAAERRVNAKSPTTAA